MLIEITVRLSVLTRQLEMAGRSDQYVYTNFNYITIDKVSHLILYLREKINNFNPDESDQSKKSIPLTLVNVRDFLNYKNLKLDWNLVRF